MGVGSQPAHPQPTPRVLACAYRHDMAHTLLGALPTALVRPFTVAEYLALGETEIRTELQEGSLMLVPSPGYDHAVALTELVIRLTSRLPRHLVGVHRVDIDLGLAPAEAPGTSRCPDVIVVDRWSDDQAFAPDRIPRGPEVRLVVEVVSAASRRLDTVVKRAEYAEAGIEHYWIVDLERPVSLVAFRLNGGSSYRDEAEVTGRFVATEPFDFELDLDGLLR